MAKSPHTITTIQLDDTIQKLTAAQASLEERLSQENARLEALVDEQESLSSTFSEKSDAVQHSKTQLETSQALLKDWIDRVAVLRREQETLQAKQRLLQNALGQLEQSKGHYIPPLTEPNFEQLTTAMGWGHSEAFNWEQRYNHSQNANGLKSATGFLSGLVTNVFDLGTQDKPRETLLQEVDRRLTAVSADVTDKLGAIATLQQGDLATQQAICETNLAKHQKATVDLAQAKATLAEKKEAVVACQQTIHQIQRNVEQNKTLKQLCDWHKQLLPLQTLLDEYGAKERLPALKTGSVAQQLESIQPRVTAWGVVEQKYRAQAELLEQVQRALNSDACANLQQTPVFLQLKACFTAHATAREAISQQAQELRQLQAKLKREFEASQVQKQQLKVKRSQRVARYLDKMDDLNVVTEQGELTKYLIQREATYYYRDWMSSVFAVVLGCLFGYKTEKERRREFVEHTLVPALEEYRDNGEGGTLSAAVGQGLGLFKPRSTQYPAHDFSLSYQLRAIQSEILTQSPGSGLS